MNWKTVDKDTFDNYLKSYPRPLEQDVTGICDPPLRTFNDFTLGDWPKSVVAKIILESAYGGQDEYIIPEL